MTLRVFVRCEDCRRVEEATGAWFNAADCPLTMLGEDGFDARARELQIYLNRTHLRGKHSALAVADSEGFGRLWRRGMTLVEVRDIGARFAREADEAGAPPGAYLAYVAHAGADSASADGFRACYAGEARNSDAFMRPRVADVLGVTLEALEDALGEWMDWSGAWRDLRRQGWRAVDAAGGMGGRYYFFRPAEP